MDRCEGILWMEMDSSAVSLTSGDGFDIVVSFASTTAVSRSDVTY